MAVVLVTGAGGFLGGECVRLLLERGHEVVAVVRDRDPRSVLYGAGLVDRCIEVRSELASAERLLSRYQPDRVLHLGAESQVPHANEHPVPAFESNVRGTWLLLEACRTAPRAPAGVVVASTDKIYGAHPGPCSESCAPAPRHPYEASKAAADIIARTYGHHFGMPVAVTRCANVYGPGDLHPDRLVPATCMALVRGEPVRLRSTGHMTREWIHVEDAARATLTLLERAPDLEPGAWNVGSGQRASVGEVVQTLLSTAGANPAVQAPDHDPEAEIPHQSIDSSRLRALGWAPRVELHDGLASTWAWYAARPW